MRLLAHLPDAAAERAPESVAVRHRKNDMTWGELADRSSRLAALLAEQGVRRGSRVGVLLKKSHRVPIAMYGAFKAGAAYVPLAPSVPAAQIAAILRTCEIDHLVTEPDFAPVVADLLAAEGVRLEMVLGLSADECEGPRCLTWDDVEQADPATPSGIHLTENDAAYILHTSGSTGQPKCILHTHFTGLAFVDWATAEYALSPADRLSNHSSHHTCFATFDFLAAARVGAATVLVTNDLAMMPASLAGMIEAERISVWYSVPTALIQLARRGALEQRDLSALRWVLFAGEPLPVSDLKTLVSSIPSARFSHVYGSTEVNVCTYFHIPTSLAGVTESIPIGRPTSCCHTLVVDEGGDPVESGESGELLVNGSTVMRGYVAMPDQNREVLVEHPGVLGFPDCYFSTGDQVRERPDGNLEFVGRIGRQIKLRGYRIELDEIEVVLNDHGAVEEAAVYVTGDDETREIRASVVLAGDADCTATELRRHVIQHLPVWSAPERIELIATMPRTPTGKVDRRALLRAAEPTTGRNDEG